jgi:hypothetical protein
MLLAHVTSSIFFPELYSPTKDQNSKIIIFCSINIVPVNWIILQSTESWIHNPYWVHNDFPFPYNLSGYQSISLHLYLAKLGRII